MSLKYLIEAPLILSECKDRLRVFPALECYLQSRLLEFGIANFVRLSQNHSFFLKYGIFYDRLLLSGNCLVISTWLAFFVPPFGQFTPYGVTWLIILFIFSWRLNSTSLNVYQFLCWRRSEEADNQ